MKEGKPLQHFVGKIGTHDGGKEICFQAFRTLLRIAHLIKRNQILFKR